MCIYNLHKNVYSMCKIGLCELGADREIQLSLDTHNQQTLMLDFKLCCAMDTIFLFMSYLLTAFCKISAKTNP